MLEPVEPNDPPGEKITMGEENLAFIAIVICIVLLSIAFGILK